MVQFNTSITWDLSNVSMNFTDDPGIKNATNYSTWEAPFFPITYGWIPVWGAWFYVALTFAFSAMVLTKFRSIYPASFVLLILNAVAVTVMPVEVQGVMYLLVVLGIVGVLYGLFEKRG